MILSASRSASASSTSAAKPNTHLQLSSRQRNQAADAHDIQARVCQTNGVTRVVEGYLRPAVRRPSKAMSKAFR
ncbi:hypothetical protein ACIA59_34750, partial [Micromonospora haikouensis]|uniref:hypothetical protein n=1 Tax=Micromonospora haikouensis TaxID=686309 RepID=UPI00379099F3